jgi:hypothetical protein
MTPAGAGPAEVIRTPLPGGRRAARP